MKKTLALLLALTMSMAMLTACSEDDSSKDKDSSSKADSSSVVDASSADDSSVEDSSVEDSSVEDSSEPDSSVVDSSEPDSSVVDSEDPTSTPDTPAVDGVEFGDTITTDERLFETLVADMAAGAMTMEMDIEQDGIAIYMYMTTDGTATYVDMNMMGMAITMLSTGTNTYYLDNTNKKYYEDPSNSGAENVMGDPTEELMGDDMQYISTGSVTIDGVEYVAECYSIDGEEGYFVFDGADLVAVISSDAVSGGAMVTPVTLSAKADTSKLSLPAGYTAMTDEEFAAMYEGLLG